MITVSTRHKIVKLQLWCSWRKNKLANIMNMVSWILGTIMALLFAIQSSVSITIKEAQRIFSFHIMYALPLLYLISQVRFCNSLQYDINSNFFRQPLNAF